MFTDQTWETEAVLWRNSYSVLQDQELELLLEFISRKKRNPRVLIKHFDSIASILKQNLTSPWYINIEKVSETIEILDPLPAWWGFWNEWAAILEMAIESPNQDKKTAVKLSIYLLKLFGDLGQTEQARVVLEKAKKIVEENDWRYLSARLELGECDLKIKSGRVVQQDVLAELDRILSNDLAGLSRAQKRELSAEVSFLKADILRRAGKFQPALHALGDDSGFVLKGNWREKLLAAQYYWLRGLAYWADARHEQAFADVRKAGDLYLQCGDYITSAMCEGTLGLLYWSVAEYDQAEALFKKNIEMTEKVNANWWKTVQVGNLALVYFGQGRLQESYQYFLRQLELADATANNHEKMRANGNLGYFFVHIGKFSDAIRFIKQDKDYSLIAGNLPSVCHCSACLAWAYERLGETALARQFANDAVRISEEVGGLSLSVVVLRCLAGLEKDKNKQYDYLMKALSLVQNSSRRLDEAGILFSLYHCTGEDRFYEQGVALLEKMSAIHWLSAPMVFDEIRLPIFI